MRRGWEPGGSGDPATRRSAVQFAQKGCELSKWQSWNANGTLAAAYAEVGNFDQAIKYVKQAMATGALNEQQARKEEERLKLYEQSKPARERFSLFD